MLLVPALLALAEDQLVVVLVHLGYVVPKKLLIAVSLLLLGAGYVFWPHWLLLLLRVELLIVQPLCGLERVEDRRTDRHGLLQVRGGELAELRVRGDQSLHGKSKSMRLCKKASLNLVPGPVCRRLGLPLVDT